MMRFRNVRVVMVFAVVFALAVVDARSQRVAFAQIPEAPGTFEDADGEIEHDPVGGMPPGERANPRTDEPVPDPARDTIEELQRARERASGTPEAEPIPGDLNETE
jgi:hypothetical protein